MIHLKITYKNGGEETIGSWHMPGNAIDNFDAQQDLGWHIMFSIKQGAKSFEVINDEE